MITAQQARDIVTTSEVTVKKYLNAIDPFIQEAATKGHNTLRVDSITGMPDCRALSGSVGPYEKIKVTPLQEAVIAALIKHGYSARIEPYGDRYVPPGLREDGGACGPLYQNYTIIIRW